MVRRTLLQLLPDLPRPMELRHPAANEVRHLALDTLARHLPRGRGNSSGVPAIKAGSKATPSTPQRELGRVSFVAKEGPFRG